jgi:hypothetical protein
MKKILSLLAFVAVLSVNAQTTKVLNYPFGAAQGFTCAASGTVAVTISNQMSYVSAVPTLTAAATLSLTASSSLKAGAICLVTVKTTSTEVTTLAGSVLAPAVTGAAGKTWSQAYLYNGTNFYPCGAKIQVD